MRIRSPYSWHRIRILDLKNHWFCILTEPVILHLDSISVIYTNLELVSISQVSGEGLIVLIRPGLARSKKDNW